MSLTPQINTFEGKKQKDPTELALKKLIDTFFNLSDMKDIDAQMLFFTENAEIISKSGGRYSSKKRREEISKAFAGFLSDFDVIYFLNGQQTVEIDSDMNTDIPYEIMRQSENNTRISFMLMSVSYFISIDQQNQTVGR